MNRSVFESHLRVETRGDEGPPKIVGYAARFGVKSEDLGGYREVIEPGAFRESLEGKAEVFALWNHDTAKPFARTGNGSLTLREDDKGLHMEAVPDGTSWGQDALKSVEAGTVYRTSFGFTLKDRNKDHEFSEDGKLRTLKRVGLFDVSPVTFPAYPQTRIAVRAQRLSALMDDLEEGHELREVDMLFLSEELSNLQKALKEFRSGNRSDSDNDAGEAEESAVRIASSLERLTHLI